LIAIVGIELERHIASYGVAFISLSEWWLPAFRAADIFVFLSARSGNSHCNHPFLQRFSIGHITIVG
jgi:hypothetical protein